MKRCKVFFGLLILAVLLAAPAGTSADRIQPLNLRQLVEVSATVFEGECIAVREGRDPQTGLVATWYTFEVIEGLTEDLDETITIKQYGGRDGDLVVYSPIIGFEEGERVIVFLYGKSEGGFTSAVGMHQGKFAVDRHPDTDTWTVTNGMPVFTLFEGMQERALAPRLANGTRADSGLGRIQGKRMLRDEFLALVETMLDEKQARKERNASDQ
mgnify:CR=1 FL=1